MYCYKIYRRVYSLRPKLKRTVVRLTIISHRNNNTPTASIILINRSYEKFGKTIAML